MVNLRRSVISRVSGTARCSVTTLALPLLVCLACCRAFALETTSDWVTQTETYNNWISVPQQGDTITGNLESDDFGFALTPGNYQVTINLAYLDDNGSIGGVQAPISQNADWPHSPILNMDVDPANVLITADGRHLSVNVNATDEYGGNYGWWNVVITWKARCGNCGGTSGSCAAGVLTPIDGCVHFSMGLGKDAYQQNVGQLVIDTNYPSLSLARPESIQAFLGATAERINGDAGVLRQIRTSQLLADVVVSNDFCYSVNYYTATNFSTTKSNGFYVPTGVPYTTITMQNPDASTSIFNRLQINEAGELGDHEYEYEYVTNTQQWNLTSGGGLRTETRSGVWDQSGTILTETNEVLNVDGSVAFKQIETYEVFPWGETNLVRRIVDPDGPMPQTNTWDYYSDSISDGDNYGHLAQMTTPSGYWEQYEYDSLGRMTNEVAQFGNAALGAPKSQCRVTTFSYIDASTQSQLTTVQTLLGQEIARSYRVSYPGGVSNIVCQTPGAAVNAPDNLVTVTTEFTYGPFQSFTSSIQNPDGTVSLYQYFTNSTGMTTIVFSGAPDFTGSNVVDGTETVTMVDLGNNVISNATYDVASGVLLSSAVTIQSDDLGRPAVIQYNDGTTETNQYGCCGLELQTDRQGITTSYTYDDLKRVSTATRAGITTLYTYDAEGRTLTTIRQGTDSSQILQNVSTYDAAGRLIASTNALNYGTVYSQTNDGSGNTIKTTINPDGSTSINMYAQDGSLLSVTGTADQQLRYEYGVEIPPGESVYRSYTKEIKLNTDGSDSREWTKTYTDLAGRTYKTVYASATGSPISQSFYNQQGQLSRQLDPDKVTTLYQYNVKGQAAFTGVDMDGDGLIDFAGFDRITYTVNDVTSDNGVNVNRTQTFVWATNNVDVSTLVSSVETSIDGLQSWNVTYNNGVGLTNHSLTTYLGGGVVVVTNIAPDGSYSVTTNQNGQVISVTQNDANGVQISQTTFGYDPHGRQNTVTDARNGSTTSFFNAADQVVATLTPSPDGIQAGQFITNILDSMGRVIQTILPDNTSVTNVYYANGFLQETYGSRTYPVAYTYDYAGRMKTMTTWTNFASNTGAAVTAWNYDPYRGWLTGKTYADGHGPSYFYTPAGRLMNRLWARGLLTFYSYNPAGDLSGVHYSDTTPAVGYGFDRLGRQIAVTNGATVCHWIYNDAGQVLSESYTGGPLDGVSVTNGYDQYLRRTTLSVLSGGGSQLLASTAYGYDAASRLATVSDGTNTAAYGYVANSSLVGQIVFTNNGALRMTTTKQYDYLNRLTGINSSSSSASSSFAYQYNSANQRTQVTNTDNSYWVYQYDNLGQVISGKKYWADGTPVAGQQFTYNFDDIGNRQGTASGGDAAGNNLRAAGYTANSLNQYVSRQVPGYVTVLGAANSNATVTVNDQRALRQGSYFDDELAVSNSAAPLWLALTNLAVLNNGTNADIIATNTGNVLVAPTPQNFTYDADGNLTSDGLWTNVWNAENRLLYVENLSSVPAAARVHEDWSYLPDGRWNQRVISTNNGSAWIPMSTNRFVWDGQVLLAVLDQTNGLVMSFLRGTDLSGIMQGAGGVGGLLAVTFNTNGTHFATFDGNGNVAALVNAADGTQSASYEYDPFGQTLRINGSVGRLNPIRFSTQFADDYISDVKYLYRDYVPSMGRWPNRDPLGERGGRNLYGFVGNNPISRLDKFGLFSFICDKCKQGNVRYVKFAGFDLVPLINHGNPNSVASAVSALDNSELIGNISDFADIATGVTAEEVIKEISSAASSSGISQGMTWGWSGTIVNAINSIGQLYAQQQGVLIDIDISWQKCEETGLPLFQHLDWVGHSQWNISSAEGNGPGGGFDWNDTINITRAIPFSIVEAEQSISY